MTTSTPPRLDRVTVRASETAHLRHDGAEVTLCGRPVRSLLAPAGLVDCPTCGQLLAAETGR